MKRDGRQGGLAARMARMMLLGGSMLAVVTGVRPSPLKSPSYSMSTFFTGPLDSCDYDDLLVSD